MTSSLVRQVLLLAVVAMPASAQGGLPPATGTPGTPGELRTVDGRVLLGGAAPAPVPGHYVVLHRISADAAGPVDSVRTARDGSYRFQYRLESTTSMYIVSSRYASVAYFTPPLRAARVTGAEAELMVYDTTSVAFPLAVRSRHFVVSPPDESGLRRVVDVFEVANDSARTLVSTGTQGTWRVALPAGARDPQSSGGDLPAEALQFSDGVVTLQAPFPPGSRQLALSYLMPRAAPIEVRVAEPTARMELLVEGGGATVTSDALAAEAPVTLEGRSFQRFVGGPIPAGNQVTVRFGGDGLGGRSGQLALLGLAAVALALGIVYGRRALATEPAAAPPAPDAERLARAVAALDAYYGDPQRQDAASQATYAERRAGLKRQLVGALESEAGRE